MKKMILASLVIFSLYANAQRMSTADNQDYAIVLADGLTQQQWQMCAQAIRNLSVEGTRFTFARVLGLVTANLSSVNASKVAKSGCVHSVELEQSAGIK